VLLLLVSTLIAIYMTVSPWSRADSLAIANPVVSPPFLRCGAAWLALARQKPRCRSAQTNCPALFISLETAIVFTARPFDTSVLLPNLGRLQQP
jgi:hypothetical protein